MLTQLEFDYLLGLEKLFLTSDQITLNVGDKWSREIASVSTKDKFILDFNRSTIEIKKYSTNKRFKGNIVLFRYCALWRHTNPIGTDELTFDGPHVHIYNEKFGDRWALPVSEIGIVPSDDINAVMDKILKYCNVKFEPNFIKRTLY